MNRLEPRFIDDLRRKDAHIAKPWWVPPEKEREWKRHTATVFETLNNHKLPVVLIDNVSDYYYTASDQEYWDLRDHFPNLAPPWPQFWMEHKLPRTIHSKEEGDTNVAQFCRGRVGVLMTAVEPKDAKGEGIPENARWIYWAEIFIDYGMAGVTAMGSHGAIMLAVDQEGRIIDRPWIQGLNRAGQYEDQMRSLASWLNPAWLAVCFLHCKNVTLTDNRPEEPQRLKHLRKFGVNPAPYKTLVIEPMKQVLRTEGRAGEVGVQKALHICRGHFRDYREGRGLFGKYKVQVWMPSIVRGTKGAGGREEAPPREIEVKI